MLYKCKTPCQLKSYNSLCPFRKIEIKTYLSLQLWPQKRNGIVPVLIGDNRALSSRVFIGYRYSRTRHTAPLVSVTVPVTAPVTAVCATTLKEHRWNTKRVTETTINDEQYNLILAFPAFPSGSLTSIKLFFFLTSPIFLASY